MVKPGNPAPSLDIDTVQHGHWSLAKTVPPALDLIAIYRGSFCPYCKGFISAVATRLPAFRQRGIAPIAISMDNEERAQTASSEWNLAEIPVGFGLPLETARAWGLFLTTREQDGRTITFCEPAVAIITPDKRIFALLLQSVPCGRPDLDNLLDGLDFLARQGYPIRGAA
jgi:peroxiredoxin